MPYGSALLAVWLVASPGPVLQQPAPPAAQNAPDAEYYFLLGRYLEGSGKGEDAEAALKQAIVLAPHSAERALNCRPSMPGRTRPWKRSMPQKTR
jgi:hypothetical protein